jgi:hypothetical protein
MEDWTMRMADTTELSDQALATTDGLAPRRRVRRNGSLVTVVGLVEGEVLTHLEEHGATVLRTLIRALEWSAAKVLMGVGALARRGLVSIVQQDGTLIIELRPESEWPEGAGVDALCGPWRT